MKPVKELVADLSKSRDIKAAELSNKYTSSHTDKTLRELTSWAKTKSRSKTVTVVAFVK